MEDEDRRKPQRLSPSEVTEKFAGMSPLRATKYLHKCLMNKETPSQNVDMLLQYRDQNPEKFLTEEQLAAEESKRKKPWGFGFGGKKSYGEGKKSPPRAWKSMSEAEKVFENMDPYRATTYAHAILRNPDTPPGNRALVQEFMNGNSEKFLTNDDLENERTRRAQMAEADGGRKRRYSGNFDGDGALRGYGRKDYGYKGGYNMDSRRSYEDRGNNERHFWYFLWKPKEEFDAMTPKKKKFFTRFYRNKTRAQNTAYGLRVMTNPNTSRADKDAVSDLVNENPEMFFRKAPQDQEFSNPKIDD